jgi:putative ABC transport system permease protein
VRNFKKNPLYTFINVFGLGLSLACFTVLFLFIQHETSYDKFHQKADRIFRVIEYIEKSGVGEHSASVPFPTASTLQKQFPQEIEKTVRLFNYQAPILSIHYDTLNFNEPRFFFADSTFLDIFDFPLVLGDSKTALQKPNQVIITQKIAKKYFGNKNPINKIILFQNEVPLLVVGVFQDIHIASHLDFDFVASLSTLNNRYISRFYTNWRWNPCWTYLLLRQKEDVKTIEATFATFVKQNFDSELKNTTQLLLQPMIDIHLYSNLDYEISTNGEITYIYIFSVMALFILLLAAINFMNLSTAKSSLRAKEILVRKMMGAGQYELSKQFIYESFLLGILGILVAFIIIETVAPHLTDLSGKTLPENFVHGQNMIVCILVTGLFLGICSGAYPAYSFATYNPMDILRGKLDLGYVGYGSKWFRRVSVMVQFVMTSLLLMTTFVSRKQLEFMQNKQLGFDTEQILIIPVAQQNNIINQYEEIKRKFLANPSIISVTAMEEILGANRQTHRFMVDKADTAVYFPSLHIRYDFLKTFNIKLIAGRDFTDNIVEEKQLRIKEKFNQQTITQQNSNPTNDTDHNNSNNNREKTDDENGAVIINQAMLKHLGWKTPQEALGKTFKSARGNEKVVGVVEDFHFTSLHSEVTPFVFDVPQDYEKIVYTKYIAIKFDHNNAKDLKNFINTVWSQYTQAPLNAFLLNENLSKLYRKEQQLSEIAGVFSIIGILISCMGLFGLSSFVIESRYKEIGIRKALGASWIDLVYLLSKTYFIIAFLSVCIAGILGYSVLYWWLNSFPYRIDFDIFVFLKTVLVVFSVTFFTISYHTIKAASQNPAEVIRYKM